MTLELQLSDLIPSDGQVCVLRNRADHRLSIWGSCDNSGPLVFPSRIVAELYIKRLAPMLRDLNHDPSQWYAATLNFDQLLDEARTAEHGYLYFPTKGRKYLQARLADFTAARANVQ